MPDTYAQISNGAVINMILASVGDYFDPAFVWVDVTSLSPQPGIGWAYDGTNFTAPPPPSVDWAGLLESDIDSIHYSYLQALSDYQAAVAASAQATANTGVTAGLSDSSASYSPNEAAPFEAFVALVQSGG
jgi:hypothetical protein